MSASITPDQAAIGNVANLPGPKATSAVYVVNTFSAPMSSVAPINARRIVRRRAAWFLGQRGSAGTCCGSDG
jgi:hypothetical protein